MGNACTCINEDQKDRDEFKSATTEKLPINEESVVKIQTNYRGWKARKQYKEMKQQASRGGNMSWVVQENEP